MNREVPRPSKPLYLISVLYLTVCALPCVGATALMMTSGSESVIAVVPASVTALFGYFQYSALFHTNLGHSRTMFNCSMILGIMSLFTFGLLSVIMAIGIVLTGFAWEKLLAVIATAFPPTFFISHAVLHQAWLEKLERLPLELAIPPESKKFTLRELFLLTTVIALILGAAKLLTFQSSEHSAKEHANFID